MANSSSIARDLREFLKVLEAGGELQRVVAEVDWNLEAGAISRLVCERQEPAPLFEHIKGYPDHRMAGVLLGPGRPLHARLAMAMGLEDRTVGPLDLIERIRHGLNNPRKPISVARGDAPCKEVVIPKEKVNLLDLPAPWIKSIDGGRYIGTWDIVVIKDPESGWVNWAIYRCMVKDEKSFAILLLPSAQHGGHIFAKYEAAGKPMPIALVIGAHPLLHLAAIGNLDYDVSEADAAGGLLGEGVPLVRCETSDLEVPANAEMVIEAEVIPGVRVEEGPFGEYTGHSAHRGKSPLARIKCITHRRNPIHTMANMGKPWDDCAVPESLLRSAVAKERLVRAHIPVKSVYYHFGLTPVVSVKPKPGVHKQILATMLSAPRLIQFGVVFVEEDVDVTDLQDVFWAISTRMHPKSYQTVDNIAANPLCPFLTPEERTTMETSIWMMPASLPHSWSEEYRRDHASVSDFAQGWTRDIQDKVLSRWREYGYSDKNRNG